MAILTSYSETNVDADAVIGDIGDFDIQNAQGFQISETANCESVELYLKDGPAGTPAQDVTVSIMTDNAGVPSGTLVNANATTTIAAASIGAAYSYLTATFPGNFVLSAGVQYHIVALVPIQATGIRFIWGRDNSSPSYAGGSASSSTDAGVSWANYPADLVFIVNGTVVSLGIYTII